MKTGCSIISAPLSGHEAALESGPIFAQYRRSDPPAERPLQTQGEGVGGGVNPSPKGKKGVKEEGLPKPLTPKGLVGLS